MATVRQYYNGLKVTRDAVCQYMGTIPDSQPADRRAFMNATLMCVAIIVKAIVDKGVITDADLTAARNSAIGDVWDQEQSRY